MVSPWRACSESRALTGREIERAYADKGYRGHSAPKLLRVFISGQKRGVFGATKRGLSRRSAIEPVIGHMKGDGHLGRTTSKDGTATAPTPSAAPPAITSTISSRG